MHLERINLLPPDRLAALRRGYFMRLGALAALILIALLAVHAMLLIPTHEFLVRQVEAKQAELDALSGNDTSAEEAAFETRLSALSASAARIIALKNSPSASGTLMQVLQIPHANVSLTGLTYTAAQGAHAATVAVTGVAGTRDSLRQYQLALQNASFISAADLPVSAYAQDTKIPFTIQLTLVQP